MFPSGWIKQYGMLNVIGLGGVSLEDSRLAKRSQRIFSYLLVFVGIGLLYQWHERVVGACSHQQNYWMVCGAWIFLLIEMLVMLLLSSNAVLYIKHNWLKLGILFLGIPYVLDISWLVNILNHGQPLLALVIMLPSLETLKEFLVDGYLGTTLIATLIIIVVVGILAAGVDPNIKSPIDGIWWALATISTVGYGDVVPTSLLGRLIGMVLIFFGLGLFVIITANFLAFFLKHEVVEASTMPEAMSKLIKEIHALRIEQQRNSRRIRELSERITELIEKDNE